MSYFTEALHKMIRKTPTPRIMFNSKDSSYVVVDSRTGMPRLQNQSIQPQVGMYSVLTMGDHLDVVVRYERMLPYTLPVSSDEDCPQVTYVMPRQDMKAGDFFTLFVGREHFMVQVVQILLKSSSGYSPEKNSSDSLSLADQPVQSSVNLIRHSHFLNRLINLSRSHYLLVLIDAIVLFFVQELEWMVGKSRILPEPTLLLPLATIQIMCDTKYLDINITVQAAPLPPLTNIKPSRRPESPQLSTHGKISDASKTTREQEKVGKRPAAERKNMLSTIKKMNETNRESPRPSHPLRELRNIGRGYESGTIENSSNSASPSVDSCPSDATNPRPTFSLEPLTLVESDIQEALGLDGDYVIFVAPKRMWTSEQHDFDRLRLHEGELLHA